MRLPMIVLAMLGVACADAPTAVLAPRQSAQKEGKPRPPVQPIVCAMYPDTNILIVDGVEYMVINEKCF